MEVIVKHLKRRLLIWFSAISMIPIIIIGSFFYYMTTNSIKNKIDASLLSSINKVTDNLHNRLNLIDKYSDLLFTNTSLQSILRTSVVYNMEADGFRTNNDLGEILSPYFYKDNNIESIVIFTPNKSCYAYGNINRDQAMVLTQYYDEVTKNKGLSTWGGMIENPNATSQYKNVYWVGRTINSLVTPSDPALLGVVFLLIRDNSFTSIANIAENDSDFQYTVLDSNGKLVVSNSDNEHLDYLLKNKRIMSEDTGRFSISNNGKYVIMLDTTNEYSWKVIYSVADAYFTKELKFLFLIILSLLIGSFIAVEIVSILVAKKITEPINGLSETMNDVVLNNNLNAVAKVYYNDEVGIICSGFNNMISYINELFNKLKIEETHKRFEQVKSLRYQINPHFIYNTLGSIRLVLNTNRNKEADEMLLALGHILRKTFSSLDMETSVKEEIALINEYLKIQQIWYQNKIKVVYNLFDEVNEYLITTMILQPIIENAILHGLSNNINKGIESILSISAWEENDSLYLEIKDNGAGMSSEKIDYILNNIAKDSVTNIGLKNINDRISLLYGEDYGMSITSVLNEYTSVVLKLPIIVRVVKKDEDD
jgi:two-component system sensor histidine kinase YesM